MEISIQLSETMTKYHNEKVKTAVIVIPSKGRIELALSDTARCARLPDAARRTLVNLAGGEDELGSEAQLEAAAAALHAHCRRLQGLKVDEPKK